MCVFRPTDDEADSDASSDDAADSAVKAIPAWSQDLAAVAAEAKRMVALHPNPAVLKIPCSDYSVDAVFERTGNWIDAPSNISDLSDFLDSHKKLQNTLHTLHKGSKKPNTCKPGLENTLFAEFWLLWDLTF